MGSQPGSCDTLLCYKLWKQGGITAFARSLCILQNIFFCVYRNVTIWVTAFRKERLKTTDLVERKIAKYIDLYISRKEVIL